MANIKFILKDGFFCEAEGYYVGEVTPTYAEGNGWACTIHEDGTIECYAVRDYSDGEHSMRYAIQPNGFAKLTLRTPSNGVKTIRKGYVLPKGTRLTDGVIGLSGGYIDDRYTYFRTSDFQEFLSEYKLTQMRKENPNRSYVERQEYKYCEHYTRVFTDGVKRLIRRDWPISEIEVLHATYVILQDYRSGGSSATTLITELSPDEFRDKLISCHQRDKILKELRGRVVPSEDCLEKLEFSSVSEAIKFVEDILRDIPHKKVKEFSGALQKGKIFIDLFDRGNWKTELSLTNGSSSVGWLF